MPSIRETGRTLDVHESTLRRAIKNGISKRSGFPTVLRVEEENELVGFCENMQKLGFGLSEDAVNYTVLRFWKLMVVRINILFLKKGQDALGGHAF